MKLRSLLSTVLCTAAALAQAPQATPGSANPGPVVLLRGFRTVRVHSGTVYMKTEEMERALRARLEFTAWGLTSPQQGQTADVGIEITRPFLTFDWVATMTHLSSGTVLGRDKVVAWDGPTAAPRLAALIVDRIATARGRASLTAEENEAPSGSTGGERKAPPVKHWEVKYQSGTESVRPGMKMKVVVERDRIVAEDERGVPLTIPVSAVTAISYSKSTRSPAGGGWWSFWTFGQARPDETVGQKLNKLPCSEADCLGTLALVPLVAGVGILLDQLQTDTHFITIDFQRDWSFRHVVFEVRSGDHQGLLQELQTATRKDWRYMNGLVEKTRQELEMEKFKSMPVSLDRSVTVAFKDLPAGQYQLVLLKREGDRGELYFFPGEQVDLDRLVAQALVQYEEQGSPLAMAQVRYRQENGIATLAEIRTPQRILRFTPVPLAQEPEVSALP